MIVFSTFLEINGQPTLYSVYKNKGLAFLNPRVAPKRAPIIYATLSESSWQIRGTEDASLMQQVIQEVSGVQ